MSCFLTFSIDYSINAHLQVIGNSPLIIHLKWVSAIIKSKHHNHPVVCSWIYNKIHKVAPEGLDRSPARKHSISIRFFQVKNSDLSKWWIWLALNWKTILPGFHFLWCQDLSWMRFIVPCININSKEGSSSVNGLRLTLHSQSLSIAVKIVINYHAFTVIDCQ